MSEPKYQVYTTDTSITIRERGVKGSLTFSVGGPIASKIVSDLCVEVNRLEAAVEAARGLQTELAKEYGKYSMGTTYGSTKKDETYCDGWNESRAKISDALAAALRDGKAAE